MSLKGNIALRGFDISWLLGKRCQSIFENFQFYRSPGFTSTDKWFWQSTDMWYPGFRATASPTRTTRGCFTWIRLIRMIAATTCARLTPIPWLARWATYRWWVSTAQSSDSDSCRGIIKIENIRSAAKHFGHREHSVIGGGARKSKYQHDMPGRWFSGSENYLATWGWRGNCCRKEEKRYIGQGFHRFYDFLNKVEYSL